MPCYTEPHSYCDHSKGKCIEPGSDSFIKYYKDKIEELTQLLCFLCNRIESFDNTFNFKNEELTEWWEKHKNFDERRK